MAWHKQFWIVGLAGITVGAMAVPAPAAEIAIELYKDNVVRRSQANDPDARTRPNPVTGPPNVLDVHHQALSYMAFDLNVLPQGAVITQAIFGAYDLRNNRNENIKVDLIDVSADWIEVGDGALTWEIAAASYGATEEDDRTGVDPQVLLWTGNLLMDGPNQLPYEERFATTYAPSGTTDQDLLDALNAELTTGDGQAVFVLRGTSGTNNYVPSREWGNEPPPTLYLTYNVIPEPASVALLGLGVGMVAFRRRRA